VISVYLPGAETGEKLPNQVRPQGWEHLAGPFSWCVPTENEIQSQGDDLVLPVRVKDNTMGTMAKHFHKHGRPNHSNYLFVGPPGNGKSAVEKFLAWTFLSEKRVPVTYSLKSGEEVTLVDHQTGEPFVINPTNEGTITYDFVLRKLSDAVLPEEVDPSTRLQLHNASDTNMNKASVSELGTDLKRDLSMIGRRVVVISEIHDFNSKTQTRPLKTQLDPTNVPDGLLVMADANSRSEAQKSLGEAGIGRFEEVHASQWHQDTLRWHAGEYFRHFGIEFSEGFEKAPAAVTAERAAGSIRELLFLVQNLRDADQPITPDAVNRLFQKRVEDDGQSIGQDVWKYLNSVADGNRRTATFVNELAVREVQPQRFLQNLCQHLLANQAGALNSVEVQAIMSDLRAACDYGLHEGPPCSAVIWASLVEPLDQLASTISNQPASNQPASKATASQATSSERMSSKRAYGNG